MSQEQIEKALDQLRHEITNLRDENPATRKRLTTLVESIERGAKAPDSDHEGLIEEIRGSIEQFEVEHPSTTGVLNQIMLTLSNMGI